MNLFILGDSISAGWGVASEEGYVPLLKDCLTKQHHLVDVCNASMPGATVLDGLRQMVQVCPDSALLGDVIINFGTNDGMISIWGGAVGVPLAVFEQALTSLLVFVQQKVKGKLLLLGTTISTDFAIQQSLCCYNEAIKRVAKKEKVIFVDLFTLLIEAGIEHVLQGDGLHPNAWGHELLAREILLCGEYQV